MNVKMTALAEKRHAGQFRDGEPRRPYIVHPRAVAEKLLEWGEPERSPAIAIAWGHDLLEDTEATEAEIVEAAGVRVLEGIKLLTRPKDVDKPSYLRRVAASGRREELLVKIADRICNTRDFVAMGDVAYAAVYLRQAECVFSAVRALPATDRTARNAVAAWRQLAGELGVPTGDKTEP